MRDVTSPMFHHDCTPNFSRWASASRIEHQPSTERVQIRVLPRPPSTPLSSSRTGTGRGCSLLVAGALPKSRGNGTRSLHDLGGAREATRATVHRLSSEWPRHDSRGRLFPACARRLSDRRAGHLEASGAGHKADLLIHGPLATT